MRGPFIFWQNIPNHLQSPWISLLARKSGADVRMVVESEIPESRRKLGWRPPEYAPASLAVGITPARARRIIEEAGPEAIHIFSGIGAYRGVHEAFIECVHAGGLRMGVMSECPIRRGVSGGGRRLLGHFNRLRFGRYFDFLLGVGEHAGVRFGQLGYDRRRVFEFAYYPPAPPAEEESAAEVWPRGKVKLLHVGELSDRKGIDRAIRALGEIGGDNWCYGLVGCGEREAYFKDLAARTGIGSRSVFWGAMPNPEAMKILGAADVLVLASRMDGYGAVVNEALLRGVPVICSADCGARQAIGGNPALGSVFESESSLRSALHYWIDRGPRTPERTALVKQLAQSVSPESGADYFLEIMAHVYDGAARPEPPWRRPGATEETGG